MKRYIFALILLWLWTLAFAKLLADTDTHRQQQMIEEPEKAKTVQEVTYNKAEYEEPNPAQRKTPDRALTRPTSRGEDRPQKSFLVEATAYILKKNPTATGTRTCLGTIAVDPKIIPLGTRLYVEGYGWGTALDTGTAIKGYKIDVWLPTYKEAITWGRKTVRVHVYGGKLP